MKRAFQWCIACRMSYHPRGDTVKIVGVNSPTNGRSCEEHCFCGEVVIEDVVSERFRFRLTNKNRVQLQLSGSPMGLIAAALVIFPRHMSRIGSNMMELLSRLLRFILQRVTVLRSARSFTETMVLLWQLSSLPQNHVLQSQRSKKQTVLHQNRLMVRVLQIRQ